MFQIGFGLGSDSQSAGSILPFNDLIRSVLSLFDTVVYTLIKYAYILFFNIASSDIINAQLIKELFGRVQLILGVVMIFKLSVSLLQVIINPELLTDQKNGFGKIVSRIIVMLAMFVAIIPLRIPESEVSPHSYNAFLNQHGLLFGTLYSLQYRILENETIAKLILGTTSDPQYSAKATQKQREKAQEKNGEKLASYLLKTFIRPNSQCTKHYDAYDQWEKDNVKVDYLIDHVNDECDMHMIRKGKNKYVFAYFPVISTICGIIILVCLVSFCIDIAIRAIKLAVLRLIAPIPIISYINPKSSENGTFANYAKVLTTTYIDMFLRLAIICFIIFIVQQIIQPKSQGGGLDLPLNGTVTGLLATVFIIIGLFLFAKQSPKFVKEALGLKGNMQNIGLSGILAGIGALATKGSWADAWDAARNAGNMQIEAYNQGKAAPGLFSSFTSGRDLMAQNLTGNPKMTYAQMKRGLGFLAREGITDDYADEKKMAMYALEDEADILKNLSDKINQHGYNYHSLNSREQELLEKIYREKLDKINGTNRYTKKDASGHYVNSLTGDQDREMRNSGMNAFDLYLARKTDAGKAKEEYQMISKEQETHGAAPSYREKYQSRRTIARFSDLTTKEGREAITSGGFRQTVRNIAGMPGNSSGTFGEHHRERTAEKVRDQTAATTANNEEIERSRR